MEGASGTGGRRYPGQCDSGGLEGLVAKRGKRDGKDAKEGGMVRERETHGEGQASHQPSKMRTRLNHHFCKNVALHFVPYCTATRSPLQPHDSCLVHCPLLECDSRISYRKGDGDLEVDAHKTLPPKKIHAPTHTRGTQTQEHTRSCRYARTL